jgi:hypothetical protein
MNLLIRFLLLTLLGILPISAAPSEERLWTGINGRTFRGTFHTFEENSTKAVFITATGQRVAVALSNLIQTDRDLLLAPTQEPTTTGGFKTLPIPDRSLTPTLKPEDFGQKNSDGLTNATWSALLWWENAGILQIPGRGDFEKRAEWLFAQLDRNITRGGRSAASFEDAKSGIEKYFADHLADTATCRIKIYPEVQSIRQITAALTGSNAVVIKMTMQYENGRDFSCAMLLESISPDGKFILFDSGKRLNGTIKTSPDGSQEWIISNRSDLTEHDQSQGARFFVKTIAWNGLLVIEPFIYATKGQPAPVPQDAGNPPPAPAPPAPPPVATGINFPEIDVPNRSNKSASATFTLTDGSRAEGSFHEMAGDSYILRNRQGRQSSVKPEQLPPDQRAALIFLRGCSELAQAPRLHLVYHFNTPTRKNVEIHISTEGHLARLSVPSINNHRIFNLANLTAADYYQSNPESRKPSSFAKFLPESLLLSQPPPYILPDIREKFPARLESFAQTTVGKASPSTVATLNSLSLRFPHPPEDSPSAHDLEIDLVRINPPSALVAILQLLSPKGPGIKGGWINMGIDLSCHEGFEQIAPFLSQTRLLPLRMSWRNETNTRYVIPEMREQTGGSFSLELISATSPDSFPDHHFHIPAAAASLESGHSNKPL